MTVERGAIVHEWVSARAGSEKVFEAMAATFGAADLYALTRDPSVELDVQGRPIRTTFLDQNILRRKRPLVLPLMPLAWAALRPRHEYDWVLSSHHAFASSNVLAKREGAHLCYVHSPARYVWTPDVDGRGSGRLMAPARAILAALDARAASRVTSFAANSSTVARRVQRFWHRDARVIFPPVDVDYFSRVHDISSIDVATLALPDHFILGLGRWIPYKRMDFVIEVGEAARTPVVIAGSGPLAGQIRSRASRASVPVVVVEQPTQEMVRHLYQSASALIFPTEEDFGIVPVEAQASGTPVVALGKGGVLDTVVDGQTGMHLEVLDPQRFAAAVASVSDLDPSTCERHASGFSPERFARELTQWHADVMDGRP